MKNLLRTALLLFIFNLSFIITKAQCVTIPDTAFVTYLQANFPTCMNGNLMDTTCSGIVNAHIVFCNYGPIRDLTGIQYFDNLTTLRCSYDSLMILAALPNTLTYIDCSYNKLSTISTLPSSLTHLYCYNNQLTSLPPLPNNLRVLSCGNNPLTSLPALPIGLTSLFCNYNQLISLPELPDTLLYFRCDNNPNLTCLPRLKKINYFYFDTTAITCLPNYPQSNTYSIPPLNSIPLCDSSNDTNGCLVLGIASEMNNRVFSFSPNPANDQLFIETNGTEIEQVNIYNAIGILVMAASSIINHQLSIENLAAGVYIAEIRTKEGSVRKRWVKM